jgi:molybdopterin-guanine dinucleotide biosynthesis protein A
MRFGPELGGGYAPGWAWEVHDRRRRPGQHVVFAGMRTTWAAALLAALEGCRAAQIADEGRPLGGNLSAIDTLAALFTRASELGVVIPGDMPLDTEQHRRHAAHHISTLIAHAERRRWLSP